MSPIPPVPSSRPPTIDQLVAFDLESAERIRAVVKRVEAMAPARRAGQQGIDQWTNSHVYAYCASGATAASGGTLGSGSAVLCVPGQRPLTAGTEPSFTFENAGGAFGGPAFILLGWVDNGWSVVVAPCS